MNVARQTQGVRPLHAEGGREGRAAACMWEAIL
jgi:hypothetical protein